jgi:hypothetical protein
MAEIIEPNIILGEFLVNMHDPQHPSKDNSNINIKEIAKSLAESAARFNIPVYVATNSNQIEKQDNLNIVPTNVNMDDYALSMYFMRWEVALNFVIEHPEIEKLALVDTGDVQMLNYPFERVEEGVLYFGDEFNDISVGIIHNDAKQGQIEDFFNENPSLQTLNPGVIVGTRSTIIEFLTLCVNCFTRAQVDMQRSNNESLFGNFEMALINFIAYRYFNQRLRHGRQVSTIFAYNETASSAWFKHK